MLGFTLCELVLMLLGIYQNLELWQLLGITKLRIMEFSESLLLNDDKMTLLYAWAFGMEFQSLGLEGNPLFMFRGNLFNITSLNATLTDQLLLTDASSKQEGLGRVGSGCSG